MSFWSNTINPKQFSILYLFLLSLLFLATVIIVMMQKTGVRGSVVGRGTMLQAGKSRVRFSMSSVDFLINQILPPASMTLGSTQRLTEMNTKNHPGGKGLRARKADNLTAICEPIV
jgi:hypothetical protein